MKSSYQRLKDRVEDLEKKNSALYADIRVLVKEPESIECVNIKLRYEFMFASEDALWNGSVTSEESFRKESIYAGGIYPMMKAAFESIPEAPQEPNEVFKEKWKSRVIVLDARDMDKLTDDDKNKKDE